MGPLKSSTSKRGSWKEKDGKIRFIHSSLYRDRMPWNVHLGFITEVEQEGGVILIASNTLSRCIGIPMRHSSTSS